MNILQVVLLIFLIFESLNIMVLYSKPEMTQGNGLGIFKGFEELCKDDKAKDIVKYLVRWIANAKVIFVLVGLTVVVFGDETVQLYTTIAFVLSITIFYITLYPLLRKLDKNGEIVPQGYSKTLAFMILAFIMVLLTGIIVYLI